MEKNIITKIGTLAEQIKETYSNWCNATSKIIKERYCGKLKQQISDYDRLTQDFKTCGKCRCFLDENKTIKHLGYSCDKDLEVFLHINICDNCGKINILSRERVGSCSSTCKPCSFHMDIKFPLSNKILGGVSNDR